MKELEKLFLEVPESEEPFFANAEAAKINHRAEEREVCVRVGCALEDGEFETVLQPGDDNSRPVQRFGYVGDGVGGRAHDYSFVGVRPEMLSGAWRGDKKIAATENSG